MAGYDEQTAQALRAAEIRQERIAAQIRADEQRRADSERTGCGFPVGNRVERRHHPDGWESGGR